jgi:carboxyl-terminal processing protease
MSGLHLLKRDGAVVVHSVDKDSPAARSGLEANDVLLKLDETLANTLSLVQVRDLLRSEDGRIVNIIFRRGEQAYRVPLQLKKKL